MLEKALFKYYIGFISFILSANAFFMIIMPQKNELFDLSVWVIAAEVVIYLLIILNRLFSRTYGSFVASLPIKRKKHWTTITFSYIFLIVVMLLEYLIIFGIKEKQEIPLIDLFIESITIGLMLIALVTFVLWIVLHGMR